METVATSAGVGAGLVYLLQRVIRGRVDDGERRVELISNVQPVAQQPEIEDEEMQIDVGMDEDTEEDDDDDHRNPNVGEGDFPALPYQIFGAPVQNNRLIPMSELLNNRDHIRRMLLEQEKPMPKKRNRFTNSIVPDACLNEN